MSLAEKAGALRHSTPLDAGGQPGWAERCDITAFAQPVGGKHVNSFITADASA